MNLTKIFIEILYLQVAMPLKLYLGIIQHLPFVLPVIHNLVVFIEIHGLLKPMYSFGT